MVPCLLFSCWFLAGMLCVELDGEGDAQSKSLVFKTPLHIVFFEFRKLNLFILMSGSMPNSSM